MLMELENIPTFVAHLNHVLYILCHSQISVYSFRTAIIIIIKFLVVMALLPIHIPKEKKKLHSPSSLKSLHKRKVYTVLTGHIC